MPDPLRGAHRDAPCRRALPTQLERVEHLVPGCASRTLSEEGGDERDLLGHPVRSAVHRECPSSGCHRRGPQGLPVASAPGMPRRSSRSGPPGGACHSQVRPWTPGASLIGQVGSPGACGHELGQRGHLPRQPDPQRPLVERTGTGQPQVQGRRRGGLLGEGLAYVGGCAVGNLAVERKSDVQVLPRDAS